MCAVKFAPRSLNLSRRRLISLLIFLLSFGRVEDSVGIFWQPGNAGPETKISVSQDGNQFYTVIRFCK
jgi:hypothetical protein